MNSFFLLRKVSIYSEADQGNGESTCMRECTCRMLPVQSLHHLPSDTP